LLFGTILANKHVYNINKENLSSPELVAKLYTQKHTAQEKWKTI